MKPSAPKTGATEGGEEQRQIQMNEEPKIPSDPQKKRSEDSDSNYRQRSLEMKEGSIDSGPDPKKKKKTEEMVGDPKSTTIPGKPEKTADLKEIEEKVKDIKKEIPSDDDDVAEQQKRRPMKLRNSARTSSGSFVDNDEAQELSLTKLIAFVHDTLSETKRTQRVCPLVKAFKQASPVFADILKNMDGAALIEALEEEFVVEGSGKSVTVSLKKWQKEKSGGELEEGELTDDEEKNDDVEVKEEEKERSGGEDELEEGEVIEKEQGKPPSDSKEAEGYGSEASAKERERSTKKSTILKKLVTLLGAKLKDRGRPTAFHSIMGELMEEDPVFYESVQSIDFDDIEKSLCHEFHVVIKGEQGTIPLMKEKSDDGGDREEREKGGDEGEEEEISEGDDLEHDYNDDWRCPRAEFVDHTDTRSHDLREIPKFDGPIRFPTFDGPIRFPKVIPSASMRFPPAQRFLFHPVPAGHLHEYHHDPRQTLLDHQHPRTLWPLPAPPPLLPRHPGYESFIQRTIQCLHARLGVACLDTLNKIYLEYFGCLFQDDFFGHKGHFDYFDLNDDSLGQIEVFKMGAEDIPDNIYLKIKYVMHDLVPLPPHGPPLRGSSLPPKYLRTPTSVFVKDPRVKDLADRIGYILDTAGHEIGEPEMSVIYGQRFERCFERDFYSLIPPPQYRLEALEMVTKEQIKTRFGQNGRLYFRLSQHPPRLHPSEEEEHHRAHCPQGHHRSERPRLHSTTSSSHSVIVVDDSD